MGRIQGHSTKTDRLEAGGTVINFNISDPFLVVAAAI